MKTYYLSPIAEQDIEEAVTYRAEENPTAAYRFLNSLCCNTIPGILR
jgi:plasmid stabilization system protein ParE